MKNDRRNKEIQKTDFSKFTEEELADAFVFPSEEMLIDKEKKVESNFWAARRIQFKNRTPTKQIYSDLLRLKFQLEDYIDSNQYKEQLTVSLEMNCDDECICKTNT